MIASTDFSSSAQKTAGRAVSTRSARAALTREETLHDAALVTRFNAGDESAFVEIMSRYHNRLFSLAHNLLRNAADAEEIVQDAFIRAHRALANFRGDSSLATWLYRIALNLSRNRYWYFFRRRRHAMLPLDAPISEGSPGTFTELVACDSPSPVREAVNNEFAAVVTACTNRLSPGQREILVLRNVQHHSYHSISRMLGVGLGTVKSRVARARTSLRVLVAQTYPEFGPATSLSGPFEPLRTSGRQEAACA